MLFRVKSHVKVSFFELIGLISKIYRNSSDMAKEAFTIIHGFNADREHVCSMGVAVSVSTYLKEIPR